MFPFFTLFPQGVKASPSHGNPKLEKLPGRGRGRCIGVVDTGTIPHCRFVLFESLENTGLPEGGGGSAVSGIFGVAQQNPLSSRRIMVLVQKRATTGVCLVPIFSGAVSHFKRSTLQICHA